MNGISQHQRNTALQIAGIIQNYRKVTTRTGKPMASFTVGTFPAKCFDVLVDTAEHWAATGKRVLVTGHVSNHDGTIELVAQSIHLAPAGQTDAQTGFAQGDCADISAQECVPMRETSTITENLSGSVSNMKTVTTHSGRPMITFRIGNSSCKAFGELASAIQKTEGKQIEISARKGSFCGLTEYAVEIVKTISGTAVNLRDRSNPVSVTASPTSHVESTQQQKHEFVALNEDERKQIAGAIGAPRPGLSETDDAEDMPEIESFDPAAYGIKPKTMKNLRFLSEPARPATSATEAEPAAEITVAPMTAPAEEAVTDKTPEVQGVISKIKDFLTSDGRKMVTFKIGPHSCYLLNKPAEFVATHAQEYEGKLIKLVGERKINERGRMAFFPEERIVAIDPAGEVTPDEVQKALEEALFEGSHLSSEGGPTFEEMEAEYKQRKRSERQAESSAVAA
jgi:hypothetical protein